MKRRLQHKHVAWRVGAGGVAHVIRAGAGAGDCHFGVGIAVDRRGSTDASCARRVVPVLQCGPRRERRQRRAQHGHRITPVPWDVGDDQVAAGLQPNVEAWCGRRHALGAGCVSACKQFWCATRSPTQLALACKPLQARTLVEVTCCKRLCRLGSSEATASPCAPASTRAAAPSRVQTTNNVDSILLIKFMFVQPAFIDGWNVFLRGANKAQ